MSEQNDIEELKERIKELESSKTKRSIIISKYLRFAPVLLFIVLILLLNLIGGDLGIAGSVFLLSFFYILITFSFIVNSKRIGLLNEPLSNTILKELNSKKNWFMVLLILVTIYALITLILLSELFDRFYV